MSGAHLDFLELNQKNVLTIYIICLISKEDIGKNPDDECRTKIFSKETAGRDSPEIIFSKERIEEHINAIHYLLGQLKAAHQGLKGFTIPMGFVNYNNDPWTKDNTTLMALYYLGVASDFLPQFKRVPNSDKIVTNCYAVIPTYSPNDPSL